MSVWSLLFVQALTDETIHDAVKMWCRGGSDREAVVARFGEIGDWNLSAVTSMKKLFLNQRDFNEDISRWDTSNVWNMKATFAGASSFNQPVEGWNTANVTPMYAMFADASSLNQSCGFVKRSVSSASLELIGALNPYSHLASGGKDISIDSVLPFV